MRKLGELIRNMREKLTRFMTVITTDHNYIHQGIGFSISHEVTGLASAAFYRLGFTTPASGKFIHWRPSGLASTESGVILRVYEDVSFSGGTAASIFNRNRLSSGTSSMQAFSVGVTATPGSALVVALTSVGSGGIAVSTAGGSFIGAENELVLKSNANYVVEVENIGSSTTNVLINQFWYEEELGTV